MHQLTSQKIQYFTHNININNFDDKQFIDDLTDEIEVFYESEDQINFLILLKKELENKLKDHESKCQSTPEECHYSKVHNTAIFFVDQENQKIIEDNIQTSDWDNTYLNEQQVVGLNKKIDAALSQLEKLGLGQEVIFEEIEELKEKGKQIGLKDIKTLLLGKIVAYGERELMKEKTIQEIFHFMNESLKQISN